MGCDIHCFVERKKEDGSMELIPGFKPLDTGGYALYGFLANVRNYSGVIPISDLRGTPEDVSLEILNKHEDLGCDAHSASWLSVAELLAFDYDQATEDRRATRQTVSGSWDGGCTCDPGEGQSQTYRQFLGEWFFDDLEKLKSSGAHRVVFWFDN